jgi:hypothetical protein
MKIIDRCPSCLSSSTTTDDYDSNDTHEKRDNKIGKRLLSPLALLVLGCDKKFSVDQHYSRFYTASTVQPHLFCRGKKYAIERKHKVKKRDLLNGVRGNGAIRGNSYAASSSTDDDNADNAGSLGSRAGGGENEWRHH